MEIKLHSFRRDGSILYVTYEGEHSAPELSTVVDFKVDLVITGKQIRIRGLSGFESIETNSVEDAFAEVARIASRISETLNECLVRGVSLPTRMRKD